MTPAATVVQGRLDRLQTPIPPTASSETGNNFFQHKSPIIHYQNVQWFMFFNFVQYHSVYRAKRKIVWI